MHELYSDMFFNEWLNSFQKYDYVDHDHLLLPQEDCWECHGKGVVSYFGTYGCDTCNGTGTIDTAEQCYVIDNKVFTRTMMTDQFREEQNTLKMKVTNYQEYRQAQCPPCNNINPNQLQLL